MFFFEVTVVKQKWKWKLIFRRSILFNNMFQVNYFLCYNLMWMITTIYLIEIFWNVQFSFFNHNFQQVHHAADELLAYFDPIYQKPKFETKKNTQKLTFRISTVGILLFLTTVSSFGRIILPVQSRNSPIIWVRLLYFERIRIFRFVFELQRYRRWYGKSKICKKNFTIMKNIFQC